MEEGGEVESEFLGIAGYDAGLEGHAEDVEWDFGPQQWLLFVAEFERSFHCVCVVALLGKFGVMLIRED